MSESNGQGNDGVQAGSGPRAAGEVDPKLLEFLVCPLTKQPLRYDPAARELVSDAAGLAYPIRDGIPIMLVDEARRIDPEGTPSAGQRGAPAGGGDPVPPA